MILETCEAGGLQLHLYSERNHNPYAKLMAMLALVAKAQIRQDSLAAPGQQMNVPCHPVLLAAKKRKLNPSNRLKCLSTAGCASSAMQDECHIVLDHIGL